MDSVPFSSFSLEHVPFPALIVRDGTAVICNSAAIALLGLSPGGPAPDFLSGFSTQSGSAVGTCMAAGRSWRLSLSPQEGGMLVVLLPEDPVSSPFSGTAALLEQMRQHVNNLSAAVQLITPDLQRMGSKCEQCLAIINQSFYRMIRLMNNTETASALADGRLTLSAGPLDLAGLCRELCREVSGLAEAAGVSFRFDDQRGSLLTTGDSGLIRDEMVQLVFPERIQPPVPVIGYPGTTIVSCCYMRAWTGYDVERRAGEDGEETYVYITDNGTAYHRSRACTHLTLSIMLVGKEEAAGMRNASGGKYSPCEKCGGEGSGIVYVTKEGDRYHSTIECSGLKRSVRCIPLSEAGGRTPCSRCAGG